MPKESDIVSKAAEFVSVLFKERLAEYLVYHTFEHSKMVADTAQKIGKGMQLGEEGIEVVMLAGWLHDTGYTEIYRGHEEISVRIATEFLSKEHYPEVKIKLVTGCIRATKIPQQPKNLLEEIVADADLSGLGRKSFFEQSELLHIEWEKALGIVQNDEEWARQNLDLLTGHRYFTNYAQKKYGRQQAENIRINYKAIRKFAKEEQEILKEQSNIDNSELNEDDWNSLFKSNIKEISKPIPDLDGHQHFANDKKAQIMIIANAFILALSILSMGLLMNGGISFTIVAIPFFLLIAVSLLTVIFSLLSVRPSIHSSVLAHHEHIEKSPDLILHLKRLKYLHYSYSLFLYAIPLCIVLLIILFFLAR